MSMGVSLFFFFFSPFPELGFYTGGMNYRRSEMRSELEPRKRRRRKRERRKKRRQGNQIKDSLKADRA